MSRFIKEAYEELLRDRTKPQEEDTNFLLNAYNSIDSKPATPSLIPGYQNLEELDKKIQKDITPASMNYRKMSLTELSKDPEFQTRADRFLSSIGSNENIFEYLRDSDFSLSSAMVRSFETGNWTDEEKEDYVYLRDKFNNTELRGFKEKFGLVKDATVDLLLDPLNIVAAFFAIPSGGATVAGRAAIGEAVRNNVKRLTKAKLQDAITKETAKSYGLYGAAEGMAWSGLHNYFMQDMDVDLGVAQDIDYKNVLSTTALGGLIGGGIGAGLGAGVGRYYGKDKFLDKEFKFVREENIDYVGPSTRELELAKFETDRVLYALDDEQYEDMFFNVTDDAPIYNKDGVPINPQTNKPYAHVGEKLEKYKAKGTHVLNLFIAKSIGKPTTEFLDIAEKSPTLQNFLRSLRYDYDVGTTTLGQRSNKEVTLTNGQTTVRTYGEAIGEYFGRFHYGLAKSFNNLYKTGFQAKILQEQNDNLLKLLRDENLGRRFEVQGTDALSIGKEYKGILIDDDIANAYFGVKTILNDIYDEALSLGLFRKGTLNKGGYFPRLFNYSALEKDFGLGTDSKFKKILIDSGHADPTNEKQMFKAKDAEGNEILDAEGKPLLVSKYDDEGTDMQSFGRNFAREASNARKINVEDLTPEEFIKAQELKADAIIQDMLQYKYVPFELRQKGRGDSNGYFQARRFRNIKDNDMAEFLEGNVQDVLEQYTTNIAQSMARKKYFGATLGEFDSNIVSQIIQELGGGDEANKIGDKIRTIFQQVTGIEQYKNTLIGGNKFAQAVSDWGKLSQQMAHLPLATLSSITEPFILLTRVGTHEVPETIGTIAKSLVSEGKNVIDRTIKGIKRIGTGDIKTVKEAKAKGLQKGFRDLEDWQWQELYQTGLALEQSVQERIAGLAGEALHGSTFFGVFTVKEAQNAFFKSNLLTQWTKAVQLASFTTGKMLIRNRARDLAKHYDGSAKISKQRVKYYEGQLEELGINSNEAIDWYRRSIDSSGEFNPLQAKGLFNTRNKRQADLQLMQQDFYKKNIIGGANRFTKEVILNPSAAEANRPLWFSSPGGSLLTQFAGYPTVFNNTVLKRFVRESVNYPALVGASKVLPTIILMTGVAHVGNLIRSNGESTQDYETGADLPAGIVLKDAVRRWGGMGPLDYATRFTSEFSERKSGNISAFLKMISGPLGQDVIDSIAYRRGLIELGATNLPYYGAYDIFFGEGTRQSLRKRARQLDKGILIPEEEENKNINLFGSGPITGRRKNKPRLFYDRGGIVKNVPNVKDEPDERVDKRTGQMYNSTSESAQDLSDRELRGQIKGLGLK